MAKVAIVTGSSSGIGLLSCVELAREGVKVVASMRNLARREKLDRAAADANVEHLIDVRELDVSKLDTIPGFVDQVYKDYRHIDVLVNNAGFAMAGFAEDIKVEDIRAQFETNFFGAVGLTKAVLPIMRTQHSGHIIMISSIGGRVPSPVIGAYDGSKFALEGWSEALRLETQSLGIKVVLIEPGAFDTDIWDRNADMTSLKESSSPNAQRGARFQDMVKALHKADAKPVAKLIARVANDPDPRLRYVIGIDAHVQLWIRRIVPWKVWEKMMAKVTKID